jgi:hypothetical protein
VRILGQLECLSAPPRRDRPGPWLAFRSSTVGAVGAVLVFKYLSRGHLSLVCNIDDLRGCIRRSPCLYFQVIGVYGPMHPLSGRTHEGALEQQAGAAHPMADVPSEECHAWMRIQRALPGEGIYHILIWLMSVG